MRCARSSTTPHVTMLLLSSLSLSVLLLVSLCMLLAPSPAHATNNGFPNNLGTTPPRGWRSWNGYLERIDQDLISAQVQGLAAHVFTQAGSPTSLLDLGYDTVGIDDGWEACGKGVNGSYHDAQGRPLVDTARFPDLAGLVRAAARDHNVSMGWYHNCCGCAAAEHLLASPHYEQDAQATAAYGFASLKVDGCGNEPNISAWAAALNATGQAILLENCNDDHPFRPQPLPGGGVDCPYNLFRTTIDQAPSLTSTLWNLWGTVPFLSVSGPGCYAYPDMLTIGTPAWDPTCDGGRGCYPDAGCNGTRLGLEAARAQFAAFAVVSSPLTLGFDLSNATEYALWWPVVAHREALAINAAWAGEAGRLLAASPRNYSGPVPHGAACEVYQNHTMPTWLALGKPLPNQAFAAVLINGAFEGPVDADIPLSSMGFPPGSLVAAHEVWTGRDLGVMQGVWRVRALPQEQAAFVSFSLVQ